MTSRAAGHPRPSVRVRRGADKADRGGRPRQGHRPAHRWVDAPRRGLRRAQARPDQGIEATTDAQGRYRLSGLPKAPAYRLVVEHGRGEALPQGDLPVPAGSPALEPVTFDIALKRGVLIRGRVTDKATGKPVPGYVHAFTFRDNPRSRNSPATCLNDLAYVFIKDDGRYEVVGLPGRNIIACRSEMRRYRGGRRCREDPRDMIRDSWFARHAAAELLRQQLPRPGRDRHRSQGRVGDAGPPGRPRPIAHGHTPSIPKASRSAARK